MVELITGHCAGEMLFFSFLFELDLVLFVGFSNGSFDDMLLGFSVVSCYL